MRDIRNSFNPDDESEELEEERYLGIIDYPRYFVPKKLIFTNAIMYKM